MRTVRSSTRKLAIFMPSRVHGFRTGEEMRNGGEGSREKGPGWAAEPIPVVRRHPRENAHLDNSFVIFLHRYRNEDKAALTALLFSAILCGAVASCVDTAVE